MSFHHALHLAWIRTNRVSVVAEIHRLLVRTSLLPMLWRVHAGAGRRLLAPGAGIAGVGNTDLPAQSTTPAASAAGVRTDTSAAAPAAAPSSNLGDPGSSTGGTTPPADSGAGTGAIGQSGQSGWATGTPASILGSDGAPPVTPASASAAAPAGSSAALPGPQLPSRQDQTANSPPAHRHSATVAAYFLITTSPDQISAITQNISMMQMANRFEQQLRLAGQSCTLSVLLLNITQLHLADGPHLRFACM